MLTLFLDRRQKQMVIDKVIEPMEVMLHTQQARLLSETFYVHMTSFRICETLFLPTNISIIHLGFAVRICQVPALSQQHQNI